MKWNSLIKGFRDYLLLERGLSPNSIQAYTRDIRKLASFDIHQEQPVGPLNISQKDIENFIFQLFQIGLEAKSQARVISGIKAFYKFLLIEDLIVKSPAKLIEGPRLARKLPDTLSYEEIQLLLDTIDMSLPLSHRNKAIIETLYACGLRVSELVNLKLSTYYPELMYVSVLGKNNKERIVPINASAIKQIEIYLENERRHLNIAKSDTDIVFLNRRGRKLGREMIFRIVKSAVANAGIQKNVSPHTFRHSFATHLVEGGADLRAVQDMLGHESIITTEIYTHVNTDYLRNTLLKYHPGNQSG